MMRALTTILAVLCASTFFGASAFAQTPAGANPVSAGVRMAWESGKRNLTRSAELMPESDYGFRPVNTVRTFGEILAHVAGANYVFCSAAKGEPPPHAEAAFEKTATTRAQIIKVLGDSIAYCDAAYAALDDKRAGETVDLPFGMGKGARATPLMINSGHVQEHYGNLVTYFRIKGMVPPSSQGQ
jgi:uncharacterized damage-inducible protein DinB